MANLKIKYTTKYGRTPEWSDAGEQAVFEVRPRIIYTWQTPGIQRGQVSYVF